MFNSILKIALITLLLNPLFSQVSSGGTPKSVQQGLVSSLPAMVLPSVDKESLLAEDKLEMAKDVPYRFGASIEVNYNLENSGAWEDAIGGRIWRLSIKSEDAYSLNLIYDRFILPEGAELYVYDEEMNTVLGAFTHKNNKIHESFSTSPTEGDITILEYFEPENVLFSG